MDIKYSFIVTFVAGFSTLIGVLPILFNVKNIDKLIVISLTFSSGVMFCISIFDLLFESLKLFFVNYNVFGSLIMFLLFFFLGLFISFFISLFFNNNDLYSIGVISMFGIIMHNIPEGILTFVASNINKELGLSLATSIMFHNIPEGISIAIPIYYSTKSKIKAFFYTFISGFSEPVGGLIAYLLFKDYISNNLVAIFLSIVCGVMVFISLFELVRVVKKYNNDKYIKLFFLIGFVFMFIILKI